MTLELSTETGDVVKYEVFDYGPNTPLSEQQAAPEDISSAKVRIESQVPL